MFSYFIICNIYILQELMKNYFKKNVLNKIGLSKTFNSTYGDVI